MAMLRDRAASASTVDARLLLSARSLEDVLHREELGELAAGDGLTAHYTLTREPPPDWEGFARRIDAEMLMTVGPAPARGPRIYACGPSAFVERAANLLLALGHAPTAIRTERFGPTG
jgi:ferredoxin-NADP reductase